jgi:hypothetical protein
MFHVDFQPQMAQLNAGKKRIGAGFIRRLKNNLRSKKGRHPGGITSLSPRGQCFVGCLQLAADLNALRTLLLAQAALNAFIRLLPADPG